MLNSQVVILSGIAGSGKSTWALDQVKDLPLDEWIICSADQYFYDDDGNYHFRPERLPEAHAQCLRQYVGALGNKVPVIIVDNTNTQVFEIAPYYALADAFGYPCRIHRFFCPPLVGARRNTHGVEVDNAWAMHRRLMETDNAQPPWWLTDRTYDQNWDLPGCWD